MCISINSTTQKTECKAHELQPYTRTQKKQPPTVLLIPDDVAVHVRVALLGGSSRDRMEFKTVFEADFKFADTVGTVEDAFARFMSRRVKFVTPGGPPGCTERVLYDRAEPLYSVGHPRFMDAALGLRKKDFSLFLRCFDDPKAPVAEAPLLGP
jgi:hypothetical protein